MFFKQRKINKLKVKIAGLQVASESSVNYVDGVTTGYWVERHESNVKKLAETEMKLSILEAS